MVRRFGGKVKKSPLGGTQSVGWSLGQIQVHLRQVSAFLAWGRSLFYICSASWTRFDIEHTFADRMRDYIRSLLPRLQAYSARLDNLSLFTDQPWVKIDDSGDRIVFVFRSSNNELLVSRNGDVQTCSWEYLDYMDSLVIHRDGQKSLYNQGFLDEQAMILVKDGNSEYLLLANENKVEERAPRELLERLDRKYLKESTSQDEGGQSASDADGSYAHRYGYIVFVIFIIILYFYVILFVSNR